MDIKHLRYFIGIVENGFNLSRTSQNLYISQPALSMMINDFEQRECVTLFTRANGKISGLTYVGENYYRDAKELLEKYYQMNRNLHKKEEVIAGNVSIGIPPLILSVIFPQILPEIMLNNSQIKFIVKEQGAYSLKSELLLGNVNFATLLYPEHISPKIIDSFEIYQSELSVFCSPKHPFADREFITWQDLHKEKIVTFDETFMIYQHLREAFERHNIHPNIVYESASWDFLYYTAKSNSDILTILPLATRQYYPDPHLVSVKIKDPVLWKVTLCRLKKNNYSAAENYIFDEILKRFR
ncbi:LysR family transcriptional regulator [Mannheimia granulomatis]|uniref:LysR family transcriptional regulator n=1 Tax=Mannheimia granulomatis TaxID=85402 RepID=A0A6G8JH03_9PAST|nr:LysR family transcriptional regulator [Mannheimia granulomatis]QIM66263.1 LysR family transcriptional regulator [Mannheimia granulomatis]